MTTFQATTIGGKAIQGARWEAGSHGALAPGHLVHVNAPVNDEALVRAVGGANRTVTVEKEEGGGYSVTLSFLVDRFTHMLEANGDSSKFDSMVWLKPVDRNVEAVTTYLFEPEACDPKFVKLIQASVKD